MGARCGGEEGRGGAGKQEQWVEAQKSKPWAAQLQRNLQEAQTKGPSHGPYGKSLRRLPRSLVAYGLQSMGQ